MHQSISKLHPANPFPGINPLNSFFSHTPTNTFLSGGLPDDKTSIDSLISHNKFDLKFIVGQLAMHFGAQWRRNIFSQLDRLLEPDDWEIGENLPKHDSLRTLLRMVLYFRPTTLPGLGISNAGNFIGAWTQGKDTLTIEFLPDNYVQWVIVSYEAGRRNPLSVAANDHLSTLKASLSGFRPDRWFGHE